MARHNVLIQHPIGGVSITPNEQRTYNEAYEMYFSKNSLDVENGMNLSAQHLKEKAAQREQLISDLLAINHLYRFYKNNLPDATKKTTSSTDKVIYWEKQKLTYWQWLDTIVTEMKQINGKIEPHSLTEKKLDAILNERRNVHNVKSIPIRAQAHMEAKAMIRFYQLLSHLFAENFYSCKKLKEYSYTIWIDGGPALAAITHGAYPMLVGNLDRYYMEINCKLAPNESWGFNPGSDARPFIEKHPRACNEVGIQYCEKCIKSLNTLIKETEEDYQKWLKFIQHTNVQ